MLVAFQTISDLLNLSKRVSSHRSHTGSDIAPSAKVGFPKLSSWIDEVPEKQEAQQDAGLDVFGVLKFSQGR